MLLCWKDDPDCRPNFEALSHTIHNLLPETYFQKSSSLTRSGDSYVEISDISSSDNTDSDTSFQQTVFTHGISSSSRNTVYGEVSRSNRRHGSYQEPYEVTTVYI